MSTPLDAFHALLYDGRLGILVWMAFWLPVLLSPLLGWVVTTLVAPAGGGSRWRRGAGALGAASVVLLALAMLARLAVWVAWGVGGGPAVWLGRLSQSNSWNLAVVALAVALGYALLYPVVCLAVGVWNCTRRRTRPHRIPLAGTTAAATLIAAPVVLLGLLWLFEDAFGDDPHFFIDVLAWLPVAFVSLAIWTRSAWEPLQRRTRRGADAPAPPRAGVNVVGLWQSIGALAPDAQPLVAARAVEATDEAGGAVTSAWRHAGGVGAAPGALSALLEAWREPDQGWLVPDLPDPTERMFLSSALLLAIREHGLPCLVVTDGPRRLRDALQAAMQASGAWSCGPLVAGEQELRSAFAGGRLPAAAFLDVTELSSEGIRALAGRSRDTGALWCRGIGMLVLSRVDRGSPLEVTHRTFVLQRLGLALRAREARWSVLATGFGGGRTLSLVEKAFPGFSVRNVPFKPRSSAEVRVWLARSGFQEASTEPWVKRAAEPVVAAGYPVSVGDPLGAFGRGGIDIWGGDIRLLRDVALDGHASVSALDEAWLVACFRALGNRIPLEDGSIHHALWGLADNPVTRFLTRDQNLLGLHRDSQLHTPRPLLGTGNRLVARTHLRAALRECQQDLHSLEDVFGRSLVDEVRSENVVMVGHAVRRRPSRKRPSRVPLASLHQDAEAATLRETVTTRVVRIKHAHSGEVLAEVDNVCAPTRYYPGRVFAVGEHRYRVPPQAYDEERAQALVEPVPSSHALTRPLLNIDVCEPTLVVAPQRFQEEALSFHLATFEATAEEQVTGFRMDDNVRTYEPIQTRYRTQVRGIFFDTPMEESALYHLARAIDAVLVAHLFAHEEDIEVFPVAAGFYAGLPAGVLVVDRFILGMGAAEALDDLVVRDVLIWVRAILYGCNCEVGCETCTTADVLAAGPNRPGVLRALGVR